MAAPRERKTTLLIAYGCTPDKSSVVRGKTDAAKAVTCEEKDRFPLLLSDV